MFGNSQHKLSKEFGILPLSLYWLFELINQFNKINNSSPIRGNASSKIRQHNRYFCVKVSALEIFGKEERVKDLLYNPIKSCDDDSSESARSSSSGFSSSNGSLSENQLLNSLTKLECASSEKAIDYFDLALNSRSCKYFTRILAKKNTFPISKLVFASANKYSQLIFVVHVQQFDKFNEKVTTISKSQLSMIEFGHLPKSRDIISKSGQHNGTGSLSLLQLGDVIMSVLNGQKSLPFR